MLLYFGQVLKLNAEKDNILKFEFDITIDRIESFLAREAVRHYGLYCDIKYLAIKNPNVYIFLF